MGEKIEKGNLVEINFTGRTSGAVFEKSEKPILVFAGEGEVVKGLDAAILASSVGEEKKVTITPAEGFGERNEELVRVVPLEQFRRQGIRPLAGMPVELDGMAARVQSVSGGRVRVDFNHELAGKTVEYEFKVEKKYATPSDGASALAGNLLPGCSASLEAGVGKLVAGPKVKKDADYTVRKLRFVSRCMKLAGTSKVRVEEEYEKGAEGASV